MKKQAENFGAQFCYASVTGIEKTANSFIINTRESMIQAKAVLAASGAKQRLLEVPGEKEFTGRGISYCASCDGPLYKNKKILVVGGGDAACDEAQYLSRLSDKIVMIHRKSSFRAQKSLAERVLSNPSISVRFNTVIESIKGSKKVESATLRNLNDNTSSTEEFSAVFVFIGSIPQTNYCPALLKKDESGSIIVNENMETNIPGLFAAGDVRTSPFRQVVTAVSDGAIAAHSASRYIDELEGRTYS
jgi:thioredoxin reductase (NADPH)